MHSRDVRRYLAGLAASVVGTSAMTLGAGIWVKTLTGSAAVAALVSVCVYVPALLAPLAGLVVDRFPRRSLLLGVNLSAAVGLLPLLLVRSAGEVWLIFVVMLGYGAVLVLIDPAETALFTELVPADGRGQLNGLRLAIQEGSKLVAPLAGAGLFAVLGGDVVAALDAATFVAAATAVALLRAGVARPERPDGLSWRSEVTAGLRHLRRTEGLGRLVSVAALAMAASGLAVAAQYALVDALHRPPAFLGVLTSLLGAGSICAGLTSGRVIRGHDERHLALLGLLAGVTGYLLIATGWLPVVAVGQVVSSFYLPWVVIAAITTGQRLTPDHLQGRVAAALTLLLFAAQPVTQAGGAALITVLNYRSVYLLVAVLALLLAGALHRTRSALRARPASDRRQAPDGSSGTGVPLSVANSRSTSGRRGGTATPT